MLFGGDPTARQLRRGGLDGPDDVVVSGAAAQVALEPVTNIRFRQFGLVFCKFCRRHNHAGRTKATL